MSHRLVYDDGGYEKVFVNVPLLFTGQWEFVVNGRKRSYNLITTTFEDACRWHAAIQEVRKIW